MGARTMLLRADPLRVTKWENLTHLPGARIDQSWSFGASRVLRLRATVRHLLGRPEPVSATHAGCPACDR